MRYYKYVELTDDLQGMEIAVSEKQILDVFFGYWSGMMKKVGREELISEENCIEDWVVINWAWEIGEEEFSRLQSGSGGGL